MIRRISFAVLAVALLAGCKDGGPSGPDVTDTTAPTVVMPEPGVQFGPNWRYYKTNRGTVGGTLSDDQQVTRATVQVNGGAEQSLSIQPSTSANFLAEVTLPLNGDNTVVVHAYDAAGNRGSSALVMTIVTEGPPPADVSSPVDGQTYSYTSTYGVSLYGTKNSYAVAYSLNGGPLVRLGYGPSACNFVCYTSRLSNLLPGENVLEVYTYDMAGNRTVRTIRFRWNELPRVNVTSPQFGSVPMGPESELRIAGSADHGQKVARLTWQVNDGPEQELPGAGGPTATFEFTAPLRLGTNQVKVNGYNSAGFRNSYVVDAVRTLPPGPAGAWASLSAGNQAACGLTTAGRTYCWGSYDSRGVRPVPEAVAGAPSFARVFSGKQLNCGIGGDGAAFCWGSQPAPVAGGHRFARLSLGGTPFACGTTVDSDAYCWGEGSAGQLGNGTTVQSAVPVAVAGGHRWNDVSAGMAHACGLNTAGAAFCWGSNSAAQLGNSSYAPSATPVAVGEGHTFASVSAGGNSSCGLDAGGTAYCWGALRAPGGVISPAPPAAVAGGLTFRSITVGDDHACGLTTAGRAYCWGSNYWGQVGNGTSAAGMVAEPAPVAGGLTFTQLTAGYGFACGVTSNGAAYCWGYGVNGQLGNGGTGSSTIPVRMIDPV
ncbi:MAG TPA: hypothetical protein VF647_22100 [Longimicrobium sp.]|jgi:alpha-tubulin suppressor-like RCC1 family protein